MSREKLNFDDLLKRIDVLIEILKILANDLKETSNNLRNIAKAEAITPVTPKIEAEKHLRTIDDVQRVFPLDLAATDTCTRYAATVRFS